MIVPDKSLVGRWPVRRQEDVMSRLVPRRSGPKGGRRDNYGDDGSLQEETRSRSGTYEAARSLS